jgi:hypothetical protein
MKKRVISPSFQIFVDLVELFFGDLAFGVALLGDRQRIIGALAMLDEFPDPSSAIMA